MARNVLILLFALFLTAPAFAASVTVAIDLSEQKMYVSVDNRSKYVWDISTARKGYRTPIGKYKPTRMYAEYYSIKYDGSPMPYSIFFYGGYAIHGTTEISKLGRPASHGCVRLHPQNAAKLFALLKRNGKQNTFIRVRG